MTDTSDKHPYGFGIIGSGFMGHTYAETIHRNLPEARLIGVSGGSRSAGLAQDYGVEHFEDFRSLCARPEVDALLIATPHAQHCEHALEAIANGKHVMIEKPMAGTREECEAILAKAREMGVYCGLAFTQRYRLCNLKAKQILASGALGRILQIHETHIAPEGITVLPKWQAEQDNLGILFGHGVHCIDSVRWLSGQEIKTVYAKCSSITGRYPVEATSSLILTLADGAVATVACSFEYRKPGFPRSQFTAQVMCENGLIDLDAYGELRVSENGGPWEVRAVQPPIDWAGKGFLDPVRLESYTAHLREFMQASRGAGSHAPNGLDGLRAVEVILAAYESNRKGIEICLSNL